MDVETVASVRRFNRTVTERVGALDESYLGRGRPLGETRLLWEIGPDGVDVRDLRRRLGLDAGYTSRLLRSLQSERLVVVEPGSPDRRVRRARLTAAGRSERAELDRLSDGLAASMLEPLEQSQRSRLVAAMDELEPPTGLLLVAHLRQRPVGCGALKIRPGRPVELKRMWVSPEVRGLGLGRRLLRELERHAASAGADTVRLETNRTLTEAIALYRKAGYREVEAFNSEAYAHHWFEKRL